jgi:hypothetical protein
MLVRERATALFISKYEVETCQGSGQEKEEDAISHLFQQLGVLLVETNAALLQSRIPSFPVSEQDGAI